MAEFQDYPKMVYRGPDFDPDGPETERQIVPDDPALAQALAEGWRRTPAAAASMPEPPAITTILGDHPAPKRAKKE